MGSVYGWRARRLCPRGPVLGKGLLRLFQAPLSATNLPVAQSEGTTEIQLGPDASSDAVIRKDVAGPQGHGPRMPRGSYLFSACPSLGNKANPTRISA